MSTLDSSIVNVALPTLMGKLNTTMVTIEWVVLIYLIAFTSLILSFGRLSDIVGRRRVLVSGHLLFTLSSLLCALSPDVGTLIFARALQGTGAAMIMSCSQALIVDAFPETERGRALGTIGTVVAAGLTSGPAIGGFILSHFEWWMIFAVNVPVGFTVAILASRILKGSEADTRRDEPFDLLGGVLIALSCGTLFTGLTHAHAWGYSSARVLGLTATGVALIVLFVLHEKRVSHPVVDPELFHERIFRLPVLSAVALYTALFTMVFLMPFYLLFPMGYSEAQVGTVMMIPFALLFVVPPFSGALADRMGSRILCVCGMAILSLALALLAWPDQVTSFPPIAFKLALAGFGVALFLPPNNTTIMSSVPPERAGWPAAWWARHETWVWSPGWPSPVPSSTTPTPPCPGPTDSPHTPMPWKAPFSRPSATPSSVAPPRLPWEASLRGFGARRRTERRRSTPLQYEMPIL